MITIAKQSPNEQTQKLLTKKSHPTVLSVWCYVSFKDRACATTESNTYRSGTVFLFSLHEKPLFS